MAQGHFEGLMEYLRQLVQGRGAEGITDRQLVDRFVTQRDAEAFAALVHRHGPMVLGVCWRTARDVQAAEDAFQATFLALVRQAGTIGRRESVGSWLFRVAFRLALKAKVRAARRAARERQTPPRTVPGPEKEVFQKELKEALDEEMNRLPERLRAPVVLWCLEGKSQAEVARELGCSKATVSGRLAQARTILKRRLLRRGLAPSAALLEAALTPSPSTAALPRNLVEAAVQTVFLREGGPIAQGLISSDVLSLLERTTPVLFGTKAKIGLSLVLLAAAGVGVWARQWLVGKVPATAPLPGLEAVAPEPSSAPSPRITDRWGDPLPPGAVARLGTIRLLHGGGVHAAAFSPDGKLLASAGADERLCVWEAATGKPVREWPGQFDATSPIAFTTDGKQLAAGSKEGAITLWDVATGKRVFQFHGPRPKIAAQCFVPGAALVAVGGEDGQIHLYQTATGQEVRHWDQPRQGVGRLVSSPDGTVLAGASPDRSISLWETTTGRLMHRLPDNPKTIHSLAFSPDGKTLAVGGFQEKVVHLWDVGTSAEKRRLVTDADNLALAFSPDSSILATGEQNGVDLWEVATGRRTGTLDATMIWVPFVLFSPQGNALAAGTALGRVRLWDWKRRQELSPAAGTAEWIGPLVFSPDGKTLATGSCDAAVRLWETTSGQERRRLKGQPESVLAVAFGPSGMVLACGGPDHAVQLWDPAVAQARAVCRGHAGAVTSAAFTSGGRLLASADNQSVRLWDAATGQELACCRPTDPWQQAPSALGFSPDGKTVAAITRELRPGAAALGDGTLWLWEVAMGRLVHRFKGVGLSLNCFAFSPDGRLLAAGTQDGVIHLWNLDTGWERLHFQDRSRGILALAFSPDGRTLASSGYDRVIHLWETATWKERSQFAGHYHDVGYLAYSPDGRWLASSSADGTALVWDATGLGQQPPGVQTPLSPRDLEKRWADLAGDDAARAFQALTALAAAPRQAVPFLENHLHPAQEVPPQRLAQLVAQMDSDRSAVREQAEHDLELLGELAVPAQQKVLAQDPSVEVRRRAERLLTKQRQAVLTGEHLRAVRAVEVLERVGTAEARRLLARLARGAPDARITQEAKASWRRLTK